MAQTPYSAAEMQALLAKGLSVNSSDLDGGKVFTGRVSLAADGKLSGTITPAGSTPIALSGNWVLKGVQLCRKIEPNEPAEVCETWIKSGAKQATIHVTARQPASTSGRPLGQDRIWAWPEAALATGSLRSIRLPPSD
jgi:hypothetical protein